MLSVEGKSILLFYGHCRGVLRLYTLSMGGVHTRLGGIMEGQASTGRFVEQGSLCSLASKL